MDLNQYDAFYRTLDLQTGRFWQIDKQTEDLTGYSPYVSMSNNPISNGDPLGDFSTWFGAFWNRLLNGGGSIKQNEFGEWYVNTYSTSTSSDGTPVVTGTRYYGKGRNQYSSAGEEWARRDEMVATGLFYRTASLQEANVNNLMLFTSSLLPNVLAWETKVLNATSEVASTVKEAASMVNKSTSELQAIAKANAKQLRELFGTGPEGARAVLNNIENVKLPDGLPKEALNAYRELINRVSDPQGTQELRKQILDQFLK